MPTTICCKGHVTVRQPKQSVRASSARYGIRVSSSISTGGIPYEGAYEVTPTSSAQVLPTEGRVMQRDVVIAPIPSNYGLITWDGSVLTVS